MRLYYVSDTRESLYVERLAEAIRVARDMVREDAEIILVEVAATKANLLRILNGSGGYERHIKRWTLRADGKLVAQACT